MTDEELQQTVDDLRGKGIEIEDPVPEFQGWNFGERVRPIEDDDERGIFADEEGVLVIERVGSENYGNVRVAMYFVADGCDSGNEVTPEDIQGV